MQARIPAHFEARYARRIESCRLPEGEKARVAWGEQTAADGAWLLDQISCDPDEVWLARLPETVALQAIWVQECVVDEAGKWHLRAVRITEGAACIASPSDPEARWGKNGATEWTGYKVLRSTDNGSPGGMDHAKMQVCGLRPSGNREIP